MKVLIKNSKGGLTSYDAIPCGDGDIIEIRNFYKNGSSRFISGKGKKWWRLFEGNYSLDNVQPIPRVKNKGDCSCNYGVQCGTDCVDKV